MSAAAPGSAARLSMTLPGGVAPPKARNSCLTIIRMPKARKNPETRDMGKYEA